MMKMTNMAQVLTHRDPTHASDSLVRLGKLRREGILCDLTIFVEGKEFKAHKAVMAACSDYFLTAICGDKAANGGEAPQDTTSPITIELQYVTIRGFMPLLDYAYSSDLRVKAADVIDVLSAASYMQMFSVANACSEFMRTNLLWMQSQPQIAGLPGLLGNRTPVSMFNNGQADRPNLATSQAHQRPNGLPEAVSNLFKRASNSPSHVAGGIPQPPPMMLPMSSSTPYDIRLQQWVDSVAGTQSFLSRLVNGKTSTPPSSVNNTQSSHSPTSTMSPASHPSPSTEEGSTVTPKVDDDGHQSPRHPASSPKVEERNQENEDVNVDKEEPSVDDDDDEMKLQIKEEEDEEEDTPPRHFNANINNNNNNNNNNCKSPLGANIFGSKSDLNRENDEDRNAEKSKNEDEATQQDAEDSWQSLQKLYNFPGGKLDPDTAAKLTNFGLGGGDRSNPLIPPIPVIPGMENQPPMPMSAIQSVLDKFGDRFPGLNALSLFPRYHDLPAAQAAAAAARNNMQWPVEKAKKTEKPMMAELPSVPPSGQYMSVRRRTLQSNVPKPHQCQICGSRFTRFHNLKQHIKLHSGIKPYECDVCGKRFTRNYTLRLHKVKHVGVRNFKCHTCDASFTSLGEFRAHLRISMHSQFPAMPNGSSLPSMVNPADIGGTGHNVGAPNFGHFEHKFLNYNLNSPGSSGDIHREGSTGTLTPPGVAPLHIDTSGDRSPHGSERSASPQDLSTTKRTHSDSEDGGMHSPSHQSKKLMLDSSPSRPRSSGSVTVKMEALVHGDSAMASSSDSSHSDSNSTSDRHGAHSSDVEHEPMSLVMPTPLTSSYRPPNVAA